MIGAGVLTVSQFAAMAREVVESAMPLAWVSGEISNFTRAASGHCYFSLKDEQAQLRCVMFRQRAQLLDWLPANGQKVELRATPTLYEPRGDFQLNVDFVRKAGLGALFEAYERLKSRLQDEGLFDESRKRELPRLPRAVGIVTSPQAAALRDVLTTLRRRWPAARVVLYPTPVQGDGSARQIAEAIDAASARGEVDVLIVCRGGGSLEDLWAFNEEAVARAVFRSAMPVVSGVGHETDVTIIDFVADRRAPTPTAAAVAAVPDRVDIAHRLGHLGQALDRSAVRGLERRMQRTDAAAARLRHPGERLAMNAALLLHLGERFQRAHASENVQRNWRLSTAERRLMAARPSTVSRAASVAMLGAGLDRAMRQSVVSRTAVLDRLSGALRHLDPDAVLERGYAIVRDSAGRIVSDAATVSAGDGIDIKLSAGTLAATVTSSSD